MQKKVVKGDFQEYSHTVGMSYHQVDNIFFPNLIISIYSTKIG